MHCRGIRFLPENTKDLNAPRRYGEVPHPSNGFSNINNLRRLYQYLYAPQASPYNQILDHAQGQDIMDYLERLSWRYACKKMDPSRKVPESTVDRILEAARLAPTSSGLQPLEVLVVTSPDTRREIQTIAWNQSMVTDCSHLLIFAAWDTYTEARINQMFDLVNEVRGIRNEGWEAYRQKLLMEYPRRGDEVNFQHAARQCYIVMMSAIMEAAFEEVDTTPMEGFDPDRLDEILSLRAQGLRSVLMLPLGYRDPEQDWLVNLKKVRRPMSDFARRID